MEGQPCRGFPPAQLRAPLVCENDRDLNLVVSKIPFRLSYLELCQMIKLLRSELHAPQIAQVAKDFMLFAFECAGKSSIGNPEDECLEFRDFFAVAQMVPGTSHFLSIDVPSTFDAEKAQILDRLAKFEAKQTEKKPAANVDVQKL
jgi:hypothetical protein